MDIFDWYFKQIVTQSQMDWAFDSVQDSMHSASMDHEFVGIVDGLGAVQHAAVADKTIDIGGPGVAYDPEGQRCYVADALTVLDCSQDEFGTSTNPPTALFERYISVFIRFDRNLTEPALDGNNVVVYTKQLESFEFFVRMGSEAAAGAAVPAPLMTDAVLVCDILVTNGFTAILNADFDLDRRQDWVRFSGAVLGDRVYGTAHDAVDDILALIESWGGALPFTFTSTWFGAAPVLGTTPPPTTIQESLDAIVFDLSQSGATPTGAELIGTTDSGAFPGGFVTPWVSADLQAVLLSLGTDLDAHIGGAPPAHPASSITFTPYSFIAATDVQAAIQEFIDDLADITATGGASRIGNDAYSWIAATTLRTQIREIVDDLAAVGVGASGALRIGTDPIAGTPESLGASTVIAALTAIFGHLNDRTERATDEDVSGAWNFDNGLAGFNRQRSEANLKFNDNPYFNTALGGTNPPYGSLLTIASKYTKAIGWGHPYSNSNEIQVGATAVLTDIALIFDADNNRRIAVLNAANGKVQSYDPNDETLTDSYTLISYYGAGTWLLEAMASDGAYIYVMAYETGGGTHKVQAFDAWTGAVKTGWPATGTLLPGTGATPLGNAMATKIIIADDPTGADPLLVTANAWIQAVTNASTCFTSLQTSDGAIQTSGAGDTPPAATPASYYPSGGLCSDGINIYATVEDSGTGKIELVSATIANLVNGSGKTGLPQALAITGDCVDCLSDGNVVYAILSTGDLYAYEIFNEIGYSITDTGSSLFKFGIFDGFNLWISDRETADDATLLQQIPTQGIIALSAGQSVSDILKSSVGMMEYDDFRVDTPPTWDEMGRLCYDGDSVWAIMNWDASGTLSGYLRRIPRAGIR